MLLGDLLRFNPLNLFLPPKVVPKSNYRVTLHLKSLKNVVREEIINKDPDLETLEITASEGQLVLRGVYNMKWLWAARWLGIPAINYRVRLKPPEKVKNNIAHLQIIGYRVWDVQEKKFDLVRWFGRLDPFHKKKVLHSILRSFPEVLSLSGLQWGINVNLNYFLNLVPSIAGMIEIQYLVAEGDEIFFYAKSSSILKPLMDFFGPQYLSVDFIDEHFDPQLALITGLNKPR